MARKSGFKPPTRTTQKRGAKTLKMEKSYTDAEYEEIFSAAISGHVAQPVDILEPEAKKSPSQAETSEFQFATMPSEGATTQTTAQPKKKRDTSSLSTFNSEDFTANATCSTQINSEVSETSGRRPITFREAMNLSKNSHKMGTLSQASTSLVSAIGGPLSQAPANLNHHKRLEWLQERRGIGLWVRCERENCQKWRYLDTQDPVDVPSEWYCEMNTDTSYNSCDIPEQKLSLFVQEDMIHNKYTAGSIVWAKLSTYPWWPAMVDDDPDTEQYYWIDGYSDIPLYYNVVFLDDTSISRSWIKTSSLISFKTFRDYDKLFRIQSMYKSKLAIAKRNANIALELTIKERLEKFSFLSRSQFEIQTPCPSATDSDDSDNTRVNKAEAKKIFHANRKKNLKKRRTTATKSATVSTRNSFASDEETSDDETSDEASVNHSQRSVQFNELAQVHTYQAEEEAFVEADAVTLRILNICEEDERDIRHRRNVLREVQTDTVAAAESATYIDANQNVATYKEHNNGSSSTTNENKVSQKRRNRKQPVDNARKTSTNDENKPQQKRRSKKQTTPLNEGDAVGTSTEPASAVNENLNNATNPLDKQLESQKSIVISSEDDLSEDELELQNGQGINEIMLEDLRSTRELDTLSPSLNMLPIVMENDESESDETIDTRKKNEQKSKYNIADASTKIVKQMNKLPKQKIPKDKKQKQINPKSKKKQIISPFKEPLNKGNSSQKRTTAISPIVPQKRIKKGFIPPMLKSRNASPASSTKSSNVNGQRTDNLLDCSTISSHSSQTAGPSVHGIAVVPNTEDNLLGILDDLSPYSAPFDLDD